MKLLKFFVLIFISLSILSNSCIKKNIKEIIIDSNPSNAKLYIDSNYIGLTPIKIELNLGEHTIELEKENYKILKEKFNVSFFSKKILFNLEKIEALFTKKVEGNINLIKIFNDNVYLVVNDTSIYEFNLNLDKLIKKVDLKEINIKNYECKKDESESEKIKFDKNMFYSPKDIVYIYLNIKKYLLSSNCFEIYEKRKKETIEILNSIILDKNLVEKIIKIIEMNFLEMDWVNELLLPVKFKTYVQIYGEYYKDDLSLFYIENLYLKKSQLNKFSIPINKKPLEWLISNNENEYIFSSSFIDYDTITLKNINGKWYILEIRNSSLNTEKFPEESNSYFLMSNYFKSPTPPKINEMKPLPEDIKKDIDKSNKQFNDKITDLKFIDNTLFVLTETYLYIFDKDLNILDKELKYIPLNLYYGLSIIPECDKFKIKYFSFQNKTLLWEVEVGSNPIFFLNEYVNNLYFLEIDKDLLYLIDINKENGKLNLRKEIIKIDKFNQKIIYPFFIPVNDKFLFFYKNELYFFNLVGDLIWKKTFNDNINELFLTYENNVIVVQNRAFSIFNIENKEIIKEIKTEGEIIKVYLYKNLLIYFEKIENNLFLKIFDLKKDEKILFIKVFDENFDLLNNILIYKDNDYTINLISIE